MIIIHVLYHISMSVTVYVEHCWSCPHCSSCSTVIQTDKLKLTHSGYFTLFTRLWLKIYEVVCFHIFVIHNWHCLRRCKFVPLTGEHFVNAFYFGRPVSNCPTSVQAWDICKVHVSPIAMGFCSIESLFTGQSTCVLCRQVSANDAVLLCHIVVINIYFVKRNRYTEN